MLNERYSTEVISALRAQQASEGLSRLLEEVLQVQEDLRKPLREKGLDPPLSAIQENLFHLVQQDDEILKMHSEELVF